MNRILAAFVFAVVFGVYALNMAPTISFWDCSEYAATCHTLEIPHPPGNPLFIMIGRVASMALSFTKDVAVRITVLSPLAIAFSAMLMYLTIIRVFTGFLGVLDTTAKRASVYTAGIMGGFFAAFAETVAFTAVEAEVNSVLILPCILCTWLVVVWAQSKKPDRDRLLVLISYIAFLGIGIHMYSMIVLLPIFLFVVLSDKSKLKDWRLWATGLLCGLIMYDTWLFLWIGSAVAVINLIMSLISRQNKAKWRLCFWIAAFGVLGYSCHFYLPARAALNPIIDEDHPASMTEFRDFLQRKQYGQGDMISRMFWRRGTLAHQFGIDQNMGYGGFHLTQFFQLSPLDRLEDNRDQNPAKRMPYMFSRDGVPLGFLYLLIYLIPTFIMLYGWWFLYKRNKNTALLLIALVAGTTIGLVFYMNFADGTRPEHQDYLRWLQQGKRYELQPVHREVRVRDYFWVAGFFYFGAWVGIGAGAILLGLFSSKIRILRTAVAPIMLVLFVVSPALPAYNGISINSRRGVFAPFDYAYNLLMSCDKDGILFTNGDNDTFPLWALQEAYGIRRDVRIVNLSLVNTEWYIKQLKNLDPKVPISFTNEEVDALTHDANPFVDDTPVKLPGTGIVVTIPGQKKQNAMRIQDKMVLNIIDSNNWKKPVYMAVTVSNDNFMGLDPYLRMEGLVYRVMPQPVAAADRVDLERTVFFLDKVYQYRGLGDGSALLDETTQKLLSNYAASFIQIALSMRDPLAALNSEIETLQRLPQDKDSAGIQIKDRLQTTKSQFDGKLQMVIEKMDQCVGIMPWDWRPRALRHEFLVRYGRGAEAEARMREALNIEPENVDYLKMLVQALELTNKRDEANSILKKVVTLDRDPWYAYLTLAKNYEDAGQLDSAVTIMRQFQDAHPGDRRAAAMISRFEEMKKKPALPAGGDSALKPGSTPEKNKG